MLLEVIAAEYLEAYKVVIVFNNGDKTIVDLEETIFKDPRPIFGPLKQSAYFKTFTISLNTICWNNEADFAPEFLYELAQRQAQKDVKQCVQ